MDTVCDDATDHVDDDICMAYETEKEISTTTLFENVNKTFYDLGNFTNKILSDEEKSIILI